MPSMNISGDMEKLPVRLVLPSKAPSAIAVMSPVSLKYKLDPFMSLPLAIVNDEETSPSSDNSKSMSPDKLSPVAQLETSVVKPILCGYLSATTLIAILQLLKSV